MEASAIQHDGTTIDEQHEDRDSHHHGEQEDEDGDRAKLALETAQSILLAAEITLPTGDLARGGCYDSLGNYYALPEHIVSDPVNLSFTQPPSEVSSLHDDDEDGYADTTDTKGAMSVVTDGEVCPEDDSREALERSEEDKDKDKDKKKKKEVNKGKGVVTTKAKGKDLVVVRARLSDGSKDVNVRVDKGDSVRVLSRKITEKAKVRFPIHNLLHLLPLSFLPSFLPSPVLLHTSSRMLFCSSQHSS